MLAVIQWLTESTSAPFRLLVMLVACSTLIELARRLASWAVQTRSASARCFAVQASFFALAIAPLLYGALPGLPLQKKIVPLPAADVALPNPLRSAPGLISQPTAEPPSTSDSKTVTPTPLPKSAAPDITALGQHAERPLLRFDAMFVAIWLIGICALVLRLLAGHVYQWALLRKSQRLSEEEWRLCLKSAARGSDLDPSRIKIRMHSDVEVPMISGLWRARILLPENAAQWSDADAELVLRHEVAHIARRDLLWQTMALLVRSVYWFQPLTWASWKLLKIERECACDDWVLQRRDRAPRYTTLLHNMAVAMRHHRLNMASISMAERHQLTERIRRALDRNRPRDPMRSWQRQVALAGAFVLALTLTIPRPFASRAVAMSPQDPAQSPAQEVPAVAQDTKDTPSQFVMLPASLPGAIFDKQNKPIAGAEVTVKLMHYYGHDDNYELVRRWERQTDARGQYAIDLKDLTKQPSQAFFRVEARADDFAETSSGWSQWTTKVAKAKQLVPLNMAKGRTLSGRVLGPDGKPLAGASIHKAGELDEFDEDGIPKSWWPSLTHCDSQGNFSIGAPKNAQIRLWVFGAGAAGKYVAVGDEADELGDIRLARGSQMTGKVLDREGEPVADVCVVMATRDRGNLSFAAVLLQFATLTDAGGNFSLPNTDEEVLLWVTSSDRDIRSGACVRGRADHPILPPMVIQPTPETERTKVVLRESPTVRVSGNVRWPGGKPAAGVQLTTMIKAAKDGWFFPELCRTSTDAEGRYALEFAVDTKYAVVSAKGKRDSQGVWHYAKVVEAGPADRGDVQSMTFLDLRKDVGGADWVLLKEGEALGEQPPPDTQFSQLDQIVRQFDPASSNQWIAAGKTPPKKRHAPAERQDYLQRLLALEQRQRGEQLGVQALATILREAESVGPDDPFYLALPATYQRLQDHYMASSWLDLVLEAGPRLMLRQELLRRAAAEHPSKRIRGLAKYHLAKFHFFSVGEEGAAIAKLEPGNDTQLKQLLSYLRNLDRTTVRAEAIALCEELRDDYIDVPYSVALTQPWKSTALYRIENDLTSGKPNLPLATFAEGLLADQTKLVVGQPVAEIQGPSTDGETFRLSDYRGKVVLLVFNLHETTEAQSDALTEIREAFPANQLAILGIEFYHNEFELKVARQSHKFWPDRSWWEQSWWGPISTAWNAHEARAYVIDQTGVIRWKGLALTEAKATIEALVESP